MKTTTLPEQPDAKSPAGADIRFIMDGETGNMIHCTVPPHQTNRATVHATVSEFWYVLEGHGEIWRDDGLESCVTDLKINLVRRQLVALSLPEAKPDSPTAPAV
jgi:mannose-6-phosphate isomerase-like protein (cupin superfamily)